jgi:hypothetical protein
MASFSSVVYSVEGRNYPPSEPRREHGGSPRWLLLADGRHASIPLGNRLKEGASMTHDVDWSSGAMSDLLGIGDRSVIAELMTLAATDLDDDFLPTPTTDQGVVRTDPQPGLAWRRGITKDSAWRLHTTSPYDDDDSRFRACDYVLIYRPPVEAEYLAAAKSDGRKLDFVVVRVFQAARFVQELNLAIAEQTLQQGDPFLAFLRAVAAE